MAALFQPVGQPEAPPGIGPRLLGLLADAAGTHDRDHHALARGSFSAQDGPKG
jgi:hypothetical protein